MNSQLREQLSVAEQAAHWVRVLKSDAPDQSAAFVEWLKASPLHVRELLLASWLDDELSSIDPGRLIDVKELLARAQSNVFPIGAHIAASAPTPQPKRPLGWMGRIAASIAVLSVLAVGAWYAHSVIDARGSYVTHLGEQRVFELADGSIVFLNTESRIQVRYGEGARDIYLREGQALFQVRHDPLRPFRVHVGAAVIQAIGTQFDVRLFSDRATVAVVEGAVQVSASLEEPRTSDPRVEPVPVVVTKIAAGEGATIAASGKIEAAASVDAEALTAWRRQRLVFRDMPLSEIANEFNRYNTAPRLRVEGDELGARQFNGSFNAHSPESLLTYLAQDEGVVFERRGNEVVIRARGTLE